MRKLRDRRGETLTETLCAVLVLALAIALLAAMTSTSFRLDQKTDQATRELYQAFSEAEKPTADTSGTGTISVHIGDAGGEGVPVEVKFYGDSEQVVSYRAKSEGSTP